MADTSRRVGVIGTGFIGPAHIEALRRLGVTVAAIAGHGNERAAEKARQLHVPHAYGSAEELIADGHHVSPTLMKMLYRAKRQRGICLVTDATAGAGLPDGSRFALSGKDCIVENGVCLLADHSALAGSAARMIDLVRVMVHQTNVPLNEAVAMATENPARAIGLETKGRLIPGADADLVVLSPQLDVLRTFCCGAVVWSH